MVNSSRMMPSSAMWSTSAVVGTRARLPGRPARRSEENQPLPVCAAWWQITATAIAVPGRSDHRPTRSSTDPEAGSSNLPAECPPQHIFKTVIRQHEFRAARRSDLTAVGPAAVYGSKRVCPGHPVEASAAKGASGRSGRRVVAGGRRRDGSWGTGDIADAVPAGTAATAPRPDLLKRRRQHAAHHRLMGIFHDVARMDVAVGQHDGQPARNSARRPAAVDSGRPPFRGRISSWNSRLRRRRATRRTRG